MSKINDGGPAFPLNPEVNFSHKGEVYPEAMGMSLRDRIAIESLGGMLAHSTRHKPRKIDRSFHWHDAIAKEAYELADAMLLARSNRGEEDNG